jgi:hypothetical protein
MLLPLYRGDTTPGTHFIGGWVNLKAGLEDMEKRKISCPYWK